MSFYIQWSIEGEKQLSRVLNGLVSDIKNLQSPFAEIAKKLVRTYSGDVFSSQGQAINERWARLSPYTVAQKARNNYPADPLIRTGTMRKSFRSVVTTDSATIYNTAEYFKYHQSNQTRKKLPRRVMMKLAEEQKTMVVRTFQKYLFQK
jgi:phage gpG-like protein